METLEGNQRPQMSKVPSLSSDDGVKSGFIFFIELACIFCNVYNKSFTVVVRVRFLGRK